MKFRRSTRSAVQTWRDQTSCLPSRDRLAAYSMLLSRGVFRRGGAPRAEREWDLIAADDPHGFANLNRLVHWRRVMPTINFPVGSATINWDGGNSVGTDLHAGLVNQATRNVTGAQQGLPAPPEVIADIVNRGARR